MFAAHNTKSKPAYFKKHIHKKVPYITHIRTMHQQNHKNRFGKKPSKVLRETMKGFA